MKPIKNPETEAKCVEIAQLAKTNPDAANKAYGQWVEDPAFSFKYWEKLALKDRILYLIKN